MKIKFFDKQLVVTFNKGKRNRYKWPFGAHIYRIEIPPFDRGEYVPKMRRINFRYKYKVFSFFINWNKYDKNGNRIVD